VTEGLLRQLAPQVLGAVVRRHGDFASAEDAVQEALLAAATAWTTGPLPDNPAGWLVRVALRRLAEQYRRDEARRRREVLAASWSLARPGHPDPVDDDTLILMFLCCHPSLTPASAIPLTLRAVGGLTTGEIAAAFLVSEATMAQRISRAKAKLKASGPRFELPPPGDRSERLRSVLHVLYVVFNEGYLTSHGPELARADLAGEAVRLARAIRASLPDDPEVAGLLALMLLTEARRPARSTADGDPVPHAEQDRTLWDADLVTEGLTLITGALRQGPFGEYQVQAAIAAVHADAGRHADTDWAKILSLYDLLDQLTDNPMVGLNRAVAVAMAHGPGAGLALVDGLADRLGDHHRFHAVRGHLLELGGDTDAAVLELRAAAARTTNLREQRYLTTRAARLANDLPGG
jgi:RNA polymerase sigma factor (sigma-70 family)